MKPKEYLRQVKYLDKEIDAKLKLIDDCRARAESTGTFSTDQKIQSSGGLGFSDWIDKVVDLEQDVNAKMDELIDLKQTINSQIDKMDNPCYRLILINHYLLDLSLGEIAAKYNYNYSYVKHVHGHALLDFKEKNREVFDDTRL